MARRSACRFPTSPSDNPATAQPHSLPRPRPSSRTQEGAHTCPHENQEPSCQEHWPSACDGGTEHLLAQIPAFSATSSDSPKSWTRTDFIQHLATLRPIRRGDPLSLYSREHRREHPSRQVVGTEADRATKLTVVRVAQLRSPCTGRRRITVLYLHSVRYRR